MGKKSNLQDIVAKDLKKKDGQEKEPENSLLPPKTSSRPYSIVIWGATGFTGSLVCKHIAQEYPVRGAFMIGDELGAQREVSTNVLPRNQ
jgi:hypothetical protein